MIPARYCTIFLKPQKTKLSNNEKNNLFLLHTQQVLPFFFQSTRAFLPLFFSQIGNLLTIKINQQRTQNGKKICFTNAIF